ncbi:MAG: ATP-dependent DNA helicase RecG [Clostridia bacterium]|nr:ATP-dependent DNA helicase RecG [Clostridia bacterium]
MINNTDIQYVKGVGEKRAQLFRQLGVPDLNALLHYFPRTYIDLSAPLCISEAPFDTPCAIKARLCSPVREYYIRKNLTLFKFTVTDGTSDMAVTLFNAKYTANALKPDTEYLFYGRADGNFVGREMSSPEIYAGDFTGFLPVYPATRGLTSKTIAGIVQTALAAYPIDEFLPDFLRKKHELCDLQTAMRDIHRPADCTALNQARKRLVFDELFLFQLALMMQSADTEQTTAIKVTADYSADFAALLPFTLTDAQQTVIQECLQDMQSGKRLHRLIQGDVGSGKTAVCAALIYALVRNGYQAAVMAPTEILAEQHYDTFCRFFSGSGIRISLLTGATKKSEKNKIKQALLSSDTDLLIGTHAMIQEDVAFCKLGLVVTDEQHRFGVAQRAALSSKGNRPHTLVLSATPIPRTLGLILYGDLDISVIGALPKGRQPIETYVVNSSYHQRIYHFIKKHLVAGQQAYIVCPLVEDGASEQLISAESYYAELKNSVFSDFTVDILHGKMKSKDKDAAMRRFLKGETDLLIATTVIEIGIDVPNASVMVIENAERFGLAQLHQLRGRIGRGTQKSTCILVSDATAPETVKRLEIMRTVSDGFKISDEDLKLRGPGDFLGTRQHGLPLFRLANLCADMETLRTTAAEAKTLLMQSPDLTDYPALHYACKHRL